MSTASDPIAWRPSSASRSSTIGDVLARHGLSRLADQDGPTGIPIRYVRERPGELLHVDVKKLGRIPDGGGHRFRGRLTEHRAPIAGTTTCTSRSTT